MIYETDYVKCDIYQNCAADVLYIVLHAIVLSKCLITIKMINNALLINCLINISLFVDSFISISF